MVTQHSGCGRKMDFSLLLDTRKDDDSRLGKLTSPPNAVIEIHKYFCQ